MTFVVLCHLTRNFIVGVIPLFLGTRHSTNNLKLGRRRVNLCCNACKTTTFILKSLLTNCCVSRQKLQQALFSLYYVFGLPFMTCALLTVCRPRDKLLVNDTVILRCFNCNFNFIKLALFVVRRITPKGRRVTRCTFTSNVVGLNIVLPNAVDNFIDS